MLPEALSQAKSVSVDEQEEETGGRRSRMGTEVGQRADQAGPGAGGTRREPRPVRAAGGEAVPLCPWNLLALRD